MSEKFFLGLTYKIYEKPRRGLVAGNLKMK